MKKLNVHCKLENNFRTIFFKSLNIQQKEIAKLIDSWQPNVCRLIKGKHLPTIEQLLVLSQKSQYNQNQIINNIERIRIGSLTNLQPNKKFINQIIKVKTS